MPVNIQTDTTLFSPHQVTAKPNTYTAFFIHPSQIALQAELSVGFSIPLFKLMHRAEVQGYTRANIRDKCRPWSHVSCCGCWVWTFPSTLDAVHQSCAGRAAHRVCLLCHFTRGSAFTASVLHQKANLSTNSMSACRVPAQLGLVSTSGDHPSQLSLTEACSGLHPARFWISPRMDMLQHLWAICVSVWPSHSKNISSDI